MLRMKINGSPWAGGTVAEMLRQLAGDAAYTEVTKGPFVVLRNGNYIARTAYDSELVCEEDELIIMTLVAGG